MTDMEKSDTSKQKSSEKEKDDDPEMTTSEKSEEDFKQYFTDLSKWLEDTRGVMSEMNITTPRIRIPVPVQLTVNGIRVIRHRHSYECQLASLWKRVVAEFIDGFILFLVKFYIIIILRDGFDITLKHYLAYLENPAIFFNFTTEIALVECISRVIIFMYETYFLYADGATPGKKIMGLRVYMVETITAIPGRNTVSAWPCKPLGWWRALFRSVLKNVGLFVFPICYGIMIHNSRSGYDHVTNTFVVDTSERPLRLITDEDNVRVPNNYF